jgi:hypothetical protein
METERIKSLGSDFFPFLFFFPPRDQSISLPAPPHPNNYRLQNAMI